MKEYKCIKIKESSIETSDMLNELAKEGWRVITSYAWNNNFLLLEREKPRILNKFNGR